MTTHHQRRGQSTRRGRRPRTREVDRRVDGVAWLVAYALGLAYTDRPDAECAGALAEACHHDAARVSDVRASLTEQRLPASARVTRANDLLDRAERLCEERAGGG